MKTEFKVKGMHCASCEKIINDSIKEVDGVNGFKISYVTGKAIINYNSTQNKKEAYSKIKKLGYIVLESASNNKNTSSDKYTIRLNKSSLLITSLIVVLIGSYFLMQNLTDFNIPTNASYVILFVTGLMTGFHCIGMCGGFMLSTKSKTPISYGVGKLISYTVIGGLFGLLGSFIIFTPTIRGVAGVIAGVFLISYGLSNLGVNFLKRIRIPIPSSLTSLIAKKSEKKKPFITGLLNGLMIACGPLQAMYIYAAGTGSVLQGALSLFFFGLGTLPVMMGFGYLTKVISNKTTHNIIKASGALMIILGLLMINYGLTLSGTGLDVNTLTTVNSILTDATTIEMQDGYQIIQMEVNRYGWAPDKFVLKTGVPVKWIINGVEITSCNNAIQVPKLGLNFDIKKGEQVIEFTPTEKGIIPWSCWMGMIPGIFVVTDDVTTVNLDEVPIQKAGLCNGGSCGCGVADNL
ncbi:MAG TPA: sulfite exporter TauE/SafE family protein [Candidatus Nanoarchaeia archaeon]|nr:sulfite exporter TauE/SafE family protein [Candidatus Nanoarchaeia archaeon]